MNEKECPYGAEECPKMNEVKKILKENNVEITELKKDIVSLNTTVRNAGYVIGICVSILSIIIGYIVI